MGLRPGVEALQELASWYLVSSFHTAGSLYQNPKHRKERLGVPGACGLGRVTWGIGSTGKTWSSAALPTGLLPPGRMGIKT